MKKNIAQTTSALRKLTLRKETIQRLTVAQLEDVAGAAPPTKRSDDAISCANTHCTTGNSFLCSIFQIC